MMRPLLLLFVIGCGGSKAPPSNTATTGSGSATVTADGSDGDCMGGGTLALDSKDCKFWGEVMGPPPGAGKDIQVLKCCYPTLEAACKNTGGCEVPDCTADKDVPAKVICKDTTHGGVPTNP